jgi:hypothetical protein
VAAHPDIALTIPKEPWFFDSDNFERGMAWYWEHYLPHWAGEPCVGEASSQTLFVPFAPERLLATLPDARFIAIMRNPVERAHSDWWMKYCTGLEAAPFTEAIEANFVQLQGATDFSDRSLWQRHLDDHKTRLTYRTYLEYGNYAAQLERYLSRFDRKQMLLLTTEQLSQERAATLERVFRFLGVDPALYIDVPQAVSNPSRSPAIGRIRRAVRAAGPLHAAVSGANAVGRALVPKPARQAMRKALRSLDRGEKPPMDPAVRERLNHYYRDDVGRLEAILERDLSHWR